MSFIISYRSYITIYYISYYDYIYDYIYDMTVHHIIYIANVYNFHFTDEETETREKLYNLVKQVGSGRHPPKLLKHSPQPFSYPPSSFSSLSPSLPFLLLPFLPSFLFFLFLFSSLSFLPPFPFLFLLSFFGPTAGPQVNRSRGYTSWKGGRSMTGRPPDAELGPRVRVWYTGSPGM